MRAGSPRPPLAASRGMRPRHRRRHPQTRPLSPLALHPQELVSSGAEARGLVKRTVAREGVVCWEGLDADTLSSNATELADAFPSLELRFNGGASFTASPEGYLVQPDSGGAHLACLSFFPWCAPRPGRPVGGMPSQPSSEPCAHVALRSSQHARLASHPRVPCRLTRAPHRRPLQGPATGAAGRAHPAQGADHPRRHGRARRLCSSGGLRGPGNGLAAGGGVSSWGSLPACSPARPAVCTTLHLSCLLLSASSLPPLLVARTTLVSRHDSDIISRDFSKHPSAVEQGSGRVVK